MKHPIGTQYKVTQKFLEPNPIYKSGLHMGTDWGCKQVPLYAPLDGEIIQVISADSELGRSMGNASIFVCEKEGQLYTIRFLHQDVTPKLGRYKEGDQIGTTGMTGMGASWHLHCDIKRGVIDWTTYRDANLIRANLVDPETFFKSDEGDKIDVFVLLDKYSTEILVQELMSRPDWKPVLVKHLKALKK